jgi:hypothetical protein
MQPAGVSRYLEYLGTGISCSPYLDTMVVFH